MGQPIREIDLMAGVDIHAWGPTEADEEAVLAKLYAFVPQAASESGPAYRYGFRVGSLLPGTVAAALNEANKWVGTTGRPNTFTREYAGHHGNQFLSAPWCDMYVTYIAHHAGAT